MMWRWPMVTVLVWCSMVAPALRAQATEDVAVRGLVEAVASLSQVSDIAGLDTLFAPDPWVEIIEGSGVDRSWTDYRDNHLKPELAEMRRGTAILERRGERWLVVHLHTSGRRKTPGG
ncbi:MAG: hypothetical protein ACREMW_06950 [Gemmatimonadales bacterium]